ncbi:MAG: PAS domain-containing protein [Desulfomicrobiaceae bacterium]|nr:PAS domain-containing protein [Desulfomicrobiaceae bacterium]
MFLRSVWSWVTAVTLGSLFFAAWHGFEADRQFRADLLLEAQGIAAGLNVQRIDQLTATRHDLDSPAYHRISQQFLQAKRLFPLLEDIYLMRRQPDGAVVFLAAAQAQSDPDAVLPGQPYPEASPELRAVLEQKKDAVEGPLADAWGEWVSALVSLPTQQPTLLGIDIDAARYRQFLWAAARPPLFLGVAFLAAMLGVWQCQNRFREPLLVALLGGWCTLQAGWAAWTLEQGHRHQAFQLLAQSEVRTAAAHLQTARDHLLGALVGLYASSEEVTPSEFFSFTHKWRHLTWLDFAGTVGAGVSTLSPATNPGMAGWDMDSIPALTQARRESLRTDLPTAALTPLLGRTTPSLVLAQPLWQKGRFAGYACLGAHLETLGETSNPGLRLILTPLPAGEIPTPPDLAVTLPIFIGGQVLAAQVTPTEAFLVLHPLHGAIATGVFGLLLTAVTARMAMNARQKRELLERLVRKRTKQLQNSLAQFRALYANAITGIAFHELIRDRDGTPTTYRYLDANPAFALQTGIDPQSIRGKTVETALGVDTPPFLTTYAQVVDTQAPISMNIYFAPMQRHFLINAFALPQEDTFATVFLDTTAWVQAEATLRAQTQLLSTILEALPLPVYIKDTEGRYQEVNPAFCAFFGGERSQYVGKTLTEAFPELDVGTFQEKDREPWKIKGTQVYTTTLVRADGSPRRILFHKKVITDGAGAATAIVGAMTDVTELEETNARLRQANSRLEEAVERIAALASEAEAARKGKERILAMLSHDLRAPAASAVNAAQLLMDTDLSPEATTLVQSLAASGQAMLDLLEDTLSLEALEHGGIHLQPRPTDLAALVRETATILLPLAQAKGLELTALAPPVPTLQADPRRIRQILTNLVSNAVKFTPAGGQIRIELGVLEESETQVTVELRVTDTGPGIAPKDHQRIFERFGQAHPESSSQGVGLGLCLCKELAQAMGGTIGVESEEGQGASFWVRLPLTRTEAAPSSPTRPRPLRVLVVDDDVVSRTVTASLIAKSGDAATAVDGGTAALAALMAAPEPFDAAVVDLRMPDMDGFTLVRRIRQGHAGAAHTAMTVVALTASDSDGPACAEAGFDAYLVKPVDATALAATFAQLASAPRLS